MNQFITTLLSIYFILFTVYTLPLKELESAFNNGDSEKIVNLASPKVLINIDGKKGVYSHLQGEQVLEKFFKSNPPKQFSVKYKGENDGLNSFAIGVYQSTNSTSFQVSIKFKKQANLNQLVSLTITGRQ